jgi:hypothetical protein
MPGGRPSTYTEERAADICERYANGADLVDILKDEGITFTTLYTWQEKHPEFAKMYTRARQHKSERLIEEIFRIADDPDMDPNDKRVRVDTRKWYAAKVIPKLYGDKSEVQHNIDLSVRQVRFIEPATPTLLNSASQTPPTALPPPETTQDTETP